MPQPRLTEAQLQQAYDAVQEHGGVSAAARALGCTRQLMENRYTRAKQWKANQGVQVPPLKGALLTVEPVVSRQLPISADECWTVLDTLIGRKRTPKTKPPKWKPGDVQRICIAGDFHAPFHDVDAVATLVADEADRTDTLIVNGDLMDFYGVSRFIKYERIPIEQEIAATDALLSQLSTAFPDVLIVDGNHDSPRFEKGLRAQLSPEMMFVIEYLAGGNLSVVRMLAKRYPNVRFAPITVGRFNVSWASQIGDLIVTHAEKYSKVPGSALRGIDEWFTDQHDMLGLDPWRVLVQAHTHQGGVFPWKSDKLLVEGGCCCETHGYQLTARIAGRPQRRGYVTLTQTRGVTDLNSVRFRWLDVEKQVA